MGNRASTILAFLLALVVVGGGLYVILLRGSSIVAVAPTPSPDPSASAPSVSAESSRISAPAAPPPGTIFKCKANGVVTYSDAPCPGAQLVDARPAMEGYEPVKIASRPAQAPPASRPSDAAASAATPSGAPAKAARCAAIEARIKQIDELARQGGSAAYQDALREERRKLVDEHYALKC